MKTLVYYTVGGNPKFLEAAELSIRTLRAFASVNPDIVILCDQGIRSNISVENVNILEYSSNIPNERAIFRKLRIFDYPNILSYDVAIFMDADILVHRDINSFVSPGLEEGALYVGRETDISGFRKNPWSLNRSSKWWNLNDFRFGQQTIEKLEREGIYPFNSGFFLFKPDLLIKKHFDRTINIINRFRPGPTDQSFMNYYFPLYGKLDYSRITRDNYKMTQPVEDLEIYPNKIIHYLGAYPIYRKIYRMKTYINSYMSDLFDLQAHDNLLVDGSFFIKNEGNSCCIEGDGITPIYINDFSESIIKMCNGRHTIPEVIDQMVDITGIEYFRVESNVLDLLDTLVRKRIITTQSSPVPIGRQ